MAAAACGTSADTAPHVGQHGDVSVHLGKRLRERIKAACVPRVRLQGRIWLCIPDIRRRNLWFWTADCAVYVPDIKAFSRQIFVYIIPRNSLAINRF